jgi:hypothetical protein
MYNAMGRGAQTAQPQQRMDIGGGTPGSVQQAWGMAGGGIPGGGGQSQFPVNPQQEQGWNPSMAMRGSSTYQPEGPTQVNPQPYPGGPPMSPQVQQPPGSYDRFPEQAPDNLNPETYRNSAPPGSRDERGDWMADQGYNHYARPWEYDSEQYQNPYGQSQMDMLGGRIEDIQSRGDAWGDKQSSFGDVLQSRAMGEGPSVAENQLQRTTDKNIAQAMAMGRGGGPASMRTAQYAGGDMNQMAAGQGAELRAGEMQKAGEQYGSFMEGARTGDMNLEAQRDDLIRQYTAAGMTVQDAQWQANMALENNRAGQHQQAQATRAGIASSNQPSPWYGLGGAALGAGGAIGAAAMKSS